MTLPETLGEVRKLTADLQRTSSEFRATAQSVRAISEDAAPRLKSAIDHMASVADNLAKATGQLDQLIAENRADLRSFARDSLPELERLLREGSDTASELRDLTRSLREDPSQLLYQQPRTDVEIPR